MYDTKMYIVPSFLKFKKPQVQTKRGYPIDRPNTYHMQLMCGRVEAFEPCPSKSQVSDNNCTIIKVNIILN